VKVKDDQGGMVPPRQLDALRTAPCFPDRVPPRLQHISVQLPRRGVVIRYEYSGNHRDSQDDDRDIGIDDLRWGLQVEHGKQILPDF
jgi:hypothetical protein